jgi:hypothetical protein
VLVSIKEFSFKHHLFGTFDESWKEGEKEITLIRQKLGGEGT